MYNTIILILPIIFFFLLSYSPSKIWYRNNKIKIKLFVNNKMLRIPSQKTINDTIKELDKINLDLIIKRKIYTKNCNLLNTLYYHNQDGLLTSSNNTDEKQINLLNKKLSEYKQEIFDTINKIDRIKKIQLQLSEFINDFKIYQSVVKNSKKTEDGKNHIHKFLIKSYDIISKSKDGNLISLNHDYEEILADHGNHELLTNLHLNQYYSILIPRTLNKKSSYKLFIISRLLLENETYSMLPLDINNDKIRIRNRDIQIDFFFTIRTSLKVNNTNTSHFEGKLTLKKPNLFKSYDILTGETKGTHFIEIVCFQNSQYSSDATIQCKII